MSGKITLEAALRELKTLGGEGALFDDIRCRGLLADRLPEQRGQITAAVTALRAGVAARLKSTPAAFAREAVARESALLTREHAVAESYAAEAVTAWARVLDLDVPAVGSRESVLKHLMANKRARLMALAAVAILVVAILVANRHEAYPYQRFGLTQDEFSELELVPMTRKIVEHTGADKIIAMAKKGDAQADGLFCLMNFYGVGVAMSDPEALKWCQAGASKDDSQSKFGLYMMYWFGYAVEVDKQMAIKYLRESASDENVFAQLLLGRILLYGTDTVPKDVEAGIKLVQAAEQRGRLPARLQLGQCYFEGIGVAQDYGKALSIFRELEPKQFPLASRLLGTMYFEGKGVTIDKAEAASHRKKASDLGDGAASYDLAYQYLNGDGVQADRSEAERLFHLADKQGFDSDTVLQILGMAPNSP